MIQLLSGHQRPYYINLASSHCRAGAGGNLSVLWPAPAECWDYGYISACIQLPSWWHCSVSVPFDVIGKTAPFLDLTCRHGTQCQKLVSVSCEFPFPTKEHFVGSCETSSYIFLVTILEFLCLNLSLERIKWSHRSHKCLGERH